MKPIYVVVLLLGQLIVVLAGEKEDLKVLYLKCREEEKVDNADIEGMRTTHELNSEGAKKMWRCLLTGKGIMKDGQFDKDGYVKMIETSFQDDPEKDTKVAAAEERADGCKEKIVAGGTLEDTAKMIHDCLKEENILVELYK